MFTTLFTLGRDAELRYFDDGTAVANLSLAYNYGKKDPATGRKPTQWLKGALYGKSAESLAPYLTKGSKIVASVKDVHNEKFTRDDGTMDVNLVGTILDVILAGSPQGQQQYAPAQQQAPARQAPARQAPARQQQPAPAGGGFEDDDIPFNQLPARYDI